MERRGVGGAVGVGEGGEAGPRKGETDPAKRPGRRHARSVKEVWM